MYLVATLCIMSQFSARVLLPASVGVPNSGKSEWIDALMVNLAIAYGWSFALCSMEKKPR